MSNFIDLTDQKFGRLRAIEIAAQRGSNNNIMWRCVCDCGREKSIRACHLRSGAIQSCGCLRNEVCRKKVTRHGMAGTPENMIWNSMHQRCRNPNNAEWKNYGERGIKVCERWRVFENFYADMGPRPHPNLSIDRINNDGDYEPGNCRWATKTEQLLNRRKKARKAARRT